MRFFNFVAIATVSALTACATVDRSAPPLEIVTVHDVPGRTKQEICGAARDWAAVSFRDSNAVIQVYDPERGTMIGKGNMTLLGAFGTPFVANFTLTVDCKDGKARSLSRYRIPIDRRFGEQATDQGSRGGWQNGCQSAC